MITKEIIREHIFLLKDEKYKEFHGSLVPGEETIIGVRVPVLRQYAKELSKDWEGSICDLVKTIGNDYYEEIMLQVMIIGLVKRPGLSWLKQQIDQYVPKISNWAICDVFCAGLKATRNHMAEMYDYLQKFLESDDEYAVRFSVVMLLDYYVNEEYLDKLFHHADRIKHDGYYVKMAVAWMLSVCFVKFYDETKAYMKDSVLDDFTYNKALQKARESYRLTPEQKAELNAMKRKGKKSDV